LIYPFPVFSTETPNTKHIHQSSKSVFCWHQTKIKVWNTQQN